VFLAPELVISAIWEIPGWAPAAVVVDDRFRVHVLDATAHVVHHFGWSGRHLGQSEVLGDATTLGLTRDGALVVAGPTTAFLVVDGHPTPLDTDDPTHVDLPGPPFEVSPEGALHLGPHCQPPGDGWFGTHGEPVQAPAAPVRLFAAEQTYVIGPLDSLLDDCVWDRVVLTGDVPGGTGIGVESFTAQVVLSPDDVTALPDAAWATRQVCRSGEEWDALVRSAGGRYLWLRLRLTGDGQATPRVDELVVEFPRIGLRPHLPAVFGAEPVSADFTDRLLAIVDRVLRELEGQIDDVPAELDPHSTHHLDRLASWIGMRPDRRLPERLQRDLVAGAGRLMDQRGTLLGLHGLLVLALGLARRPQDHDRCPHVSGRCKPCAPPRETCPPTPVVDHWQPPPLILEHFRLRRWFESGASALGDTTAMWGDSVVNRSQLGESARVGTTQIKGTQDPARDPFHVYAHRYTVFAPASAGRTEEHRRALAGLVRWAAPAHTDGDIRYVDPRMRIGVQSSIGLDTVVARLPHGVTLGATPLGPASVLDGGPLGTRPTISSRPSLAVGTTAVLG
jgi:phage tail-like protein